MFVAIAESASNSDKEETHVGAASHIDPHKSFGVDVVTRMVSCNSSRIESMVGES